MKVGNKKNYSLKKLFLFFIVLFSLQVMAQKSIPKPVPTKLVVDNAHLLDEYDVQQLENKLVALDDSTSNQVVVVTVNSLNDQDIQDVATATFRDWGIGNKKTNNGVLLLISTGDKKIRIEVGYGLEGAIPDVVASDIIANDLTPAFKQGNYYSGINKAVDDIAKAAVGEYKVQRTGKNGNGDSLSSLVYFFLILAFIIFVLVRRGGGRGGKGGGGGFIGPFILGNILGNMAGRGGTSDWGGGGFGGGGFGGGGFGGFGGGSSGGGGASGGW